ncbi:hypothetical protein TSUD_364410 [Trifolium subterraneum]|uniref:Bet v I/Major latex protein domain-containing protein n=1 Tax=Trifolium subterraneum TaxID=3900 RepID=A0A2Z6N309_TRISU|nr:hypothetical protein TSUD_364410 [Trifolium subterraneum]
MVLAGKLITEIGIKSSADKFYNFFVSQLHDVQNICEGVHGTKIHEGEDWHDTETVKHWTHVIDGKVQTYLESIEEVDNENKKIIYKVFGTDDIDNHYKLFKVTLEVVDKGDHATVKWTIEYEKINEDIDPPNGWMDYLSKGTKDIDGHLFNGEKVAL